MLSPIMKRIGLISDTHMPSRQKNLPKFVYDTFKEVDLIIHAGDFEALYVAEELESIAPLEAVYGNMCRHEVRERFPRKKILNIEGLIIGITHGSGGSSGFIHRVLEEFNSEPFPNIIICGHLHKPFIEKEGNIEIINPGSPTDKLFAPRNTIALLEIEKTSFSVNFIDIK
jgi:putative phosphoesterase